MQNNDFEEQFNNPKTKGEKEQINRIKKFSDNPAEIKQIRKKLESAGYGAKKPVRWKNPDTGPIIYNRKNPMPQRRKEDSPVFIAKKQGFFKTLIKLFTGQSPILTKKDNARYLKTSVICFFKFGCGYILHENVIKFVSRYIIKWQEKLKPIVDMLYKAGWRTESGRKYLSPFEYNIISTCARLTDEHRLHEVVYQPENTKYIFKISNAFIHYYYQIVNTDVNKLINSFQNALYTYILNASELKLKNKPEYYANFIKEFFDGRVEKDFIRPLIEAVTGDIKTISNLKKESRVSLIDTNNYRADPGLITTMKFRAEQYKAKSEKLKEDIDAEIWFIDTVLKDLQKFFKLQNKSVTAIDLALLLSSGILTKQKNVIREIIALVTFFNEYFTPIITMSFPSRLQGRMEYVQLFTKYVFGDNVSMILLKTEELKPYMNHEQYNNLIKELSISDTGQLKCATIIGDICNNFYSIGEKLLTVETYSAKKKVAVKPIDLMDINKFTIPFQEYNIMHQVQNQKKEEIFTIKNKTVREIIDHIRIFCFNFIKEYEPAYEYKTAKVVKRRTIFLRLEKHQILKEFLRKLNSDYDTKLHDSIEDI